MMTFDNYCQIESITLSILTVYKVYEDSIHIAMVRKYSESTDMTIFLTIKISSKQESSDCRQ